MSMSFFGCPIKAMEIICKLVVRILERLQWVIGEWVDNGQSQHASCYSYHNDWPCLSSAVHAWMMMWSLWQWTSLSVICKENMQESCLKGQWTSGRGYEESLTFHLSHDLTRLDTYNSMLWIPMQKNHFIVVLLGDSVPMKQTSPILTSGQSLLTL